MSSRGESSAKRKRVPSTVFGEIAARAYWNAKFEPLGFRLKEGQPVPVNNTTRRVVPTDPIADHILSQHTGAWNYLAEECGVDQRRLDAIRSKQYGYSDFSIVDMIVCGMGLNDVWYGELAPVYEFAFPSKRQVAMRLMT